MLCRLNPPSLGRKLEVFDLPYLCYMNLLFFYIFLQQFIDTFRFNAKRASLVQSRIKALERMPKVVPPEKAAKVVFVLPECDKLLQPLVQLDEVDFHYVPEKPILARVDLTIMYNSRICIVSFWIRLSVEKALSMLEMFVIIFN